MRYLLVCLLVCTQVTLAQSFFYSDKKTFQSDVYVHTHGKKKNPAVIFIHGLGDNASKDWEKSIQRLKQDYFVLAFDLPGFGRSKSSETLYSPSNYARLINDLATHIAGKDFHLIGHSLGAAVALRYTRLYEDRVKSLTLVDAAGILHQATYGKFLIQTGIEDFFQPTNSAMQNIAGSKTVHNFINSVTNAADEALDLDINTILQSRLLRKTILQNDPATIAALALVREDFHGIDQIKTRTLLIWGEDDTVAPVQTGYALNNILPHSRLKIIQGCGHVPMKAHFQTFFQTLRVHLQTPSFAADTQKKLAGTPKEIVLVSAQDRKITGNIKSLKVQNSQNIVIEDARIEHMEITDSNVEIINSDLKAKGTFQAADATVHIIGSDIYSQITSSGSTIKISGAKIYTADAPIISHETKTTVIYSISIHNGKFLHMKEVLAQNMRRSQ